MNYKHTQIGYLIIVVLIATALLFGGTMLYVPFHWGLLLLLIVILAILASFSSLTVMVDKESLSICFGYGIYKKQFLLKDIVSAKRVKNHWYYGWGIRFWLWPKMWIYNVSGFDAVELVMKDGKVVRIGSDDVGELEKAILKLL